MLILGDDIKLFADTKEVRKINVASRYFIKVYYA